MRPIYAATYPVFKKQVTGELSEDGLGWIWQCNVFGHYVLVSMACELSFSLFIDTFTVSIANLRTPSEDTQKTRRSYLVLCGCHLCKLILNMNRRTGS